MRKKKEMDRFGTLSNFFRILENATMFKELYNSEIGKNLDFREQKPP